MTDAERRAWEQQYKRATYLRRQAAGQCVVCCAPICERSVTYCAVCLDKQRSSARAHGQRRRALGLCLTCGNVSSRFIHCLACRSRAATMRLARRSNSERGEKKV